MSTAHDESGAPDRWKYSVPVTIREKRAAFAGLFEVSNRVVISIGTSDAGADADKDESGEYRSNDSVHRGSPLRVRHVERGGSGRDTVGQLSHQVTPGVHGRRRLFGAHGTVQFRRAASRGS